MDSCSAGLCRLPDPALPGPVAPTYPHGLVPESTELTLSKNTGDDEPDGGADKDLYIHTYIHMYILAYICCKCISHLDVLIGTKDKHCYSPTHH
jgi:hypothetical protein